MARNIHALMREKENGFSAVPFFHAIFTAFAVFRVIVFVIYRAVIFAVFSTMFIRLRGFFNRYGFLVQFLCACAAF